MRSLLSWPLALMFCGWLTYDRLQETATAKPSVSPAASALMLPTIDAPKSEMDKKLDKLVSWEFHSAALSDVILYIAEDLELPIRLDEKSVGSIVPLDTKIDFRLERVRARTALRLLLQEHRLMAIRIDDCLMVMSADDRLPMEMRVYPVHDLVSYEDETGAFTDTESLVDVILDTIQPEAWKESGSGEATISAVASADTLAVKASADVHDEVGRFLTTLRAVREVQGLRGPAKVRRGMGLGGSFGPGVGAVPKGMSGGGLSGGGFF